MGDYPSDLRIAEDAFRQRVAELQKGHGIGEAIHQIVLLSEAAVSACKSSGLKTEGSVFGLIQIALPFAEAARTCESTGGRLAIVGSEALLQTVATELLEADAYCSAWVADAVGRSAVTLSGTGRIDVVDFAEARWFICEWVCS